jgi:hypothetical protein
VDFRSTYTLDSVSLPGVVVTLKRMGPKRRAEVELSVAGARARQRELSIRHESTRQKLIAAIDASPKDADGKPVEAELRPDCLALALELQEVLDQANTLVREEIQPAFIKAALLSFGGEPLTYDGQAATAQLVCDLGPADFFDELIAAVTANGYFSAKEAENLSSHSTLENPAGGMQTNSTANAAKPEETSLPAAA